MTSDTLRLLWGRVAVTGRVGWQSLPWRVLDIEYYLIVMSSGERRDVERWCGVGRTLTCRDLNRVRISFSCAATAT